MCVHRLPKRREQDVCFGHWSRQVDRTSSLDRKLRFSFPRRDRERSVRAVDIIK
jgi:hypothetical protein